MLKKFKSLVSLKPTAATTEGPEAFTSTSATMQRRTEALRAAGLLPQSKIYGQRPYRDDAYAPPTILEEKDAFSIADEKFKDLMTFEEVRRNAYWLSYCVTYAHAMLDFACLG